MIIKYKIYSITLVFMYQKKKICTKKLHLYFDDLIEYN